MTLNMYIQWFIEFFKAMLNIWWILVDLRGLMAEASTIQIENKYLTDKTMEGYWN